MTRLTAELVVAALLLPAGARAQGNADISGGQCPPGWRCGSTVTTKSVAPGARSENMDDMPSVWARFSSPSYDGAAAYKALDAGQCPEGWHHCQIWKSDRVACDGSGRCKSEGIKNKVWKCEALQEGAGPPILRCFQDIDTGSLSHATTEIKIPAPKPDRSWHLLTISNGMTKRECDEARDRALPHYYVEPGDIKFAECVQ
jgi:hypothetical protein